VQLLINNNVKNKDQITTYNNNDLGWGIDRLNIKIIYPVIYLSS